MGIALNQYRDVIVPAMPSKIDVKALGTERLKQELWRRFEWLFEHGFARNEDVDHIIIFEDDADTVTAAIKFTSQGKRAGRPPLNKPWFYGHIVRSRAAKHKISAAAAAHLVSKDYRGLSKKFAPIMLGLQHFPAIRTLENYAAANIPKPVHASDDLLQETDDIVVELVRP